MKDYIIKYTLINKKAAQTFMQLKRLFYSKYFYPEVKIICYQLLIRPIIIYGCLI